MSQQSSLTRKGSRNSPSSSRRSPNVRRGFNSPKKSGNEPSKLCLGPKPFSKSQDSSRNVQKPEFYMKFTSPKKTSTPSGTPTKSTPTKKPAVPPKPRNVVVRKTY